MAELVMCGGESGEPDEEARVIGAEANPGLDEWDRLFGLADIGEQVPKDGVSRGKAGLE